MLLEERHNTIVQMVNEIGSVNVKELSVRFAVTEDSIRKDLTALQRKGLLRKTYGGALKIEDNSQERFVEQRKGKYVLDKQKIAKKIVHMLQDGDLIFLDISTTNIEVAKILKTAGKTLTIVTNMIDVMNIMRGDEHNKLIFIGGTFTEGRDGFVGTSANREISKYRFDKSFLGVVGVHAEKNTVSTYTFDDAATKEIIVKSSKQAYLILETRKLSKDGNFIYAAIDDFVGAVTEKPLEDWQKEKLSQYELEII